MHRWITAPPHPASQTLRDALGISPVLAQILAQRGYTDPEAAKSFLEPRLRQLTDPFQLPAMSDAVDAVLAALQQRKRIVIYGDYDVDGITSCTLLARVLRQLGGQAGIFLPNRMDEGYGLSPDGVERCLATHQPALLIAVDCGTSSANEIARLASVGVETIVLDHHLPPAAEGWKNGRGGGTVHMQTSTLPRPNTPTLQNSITPSLPLCRALVNPKLASPDAPWFHLCSVGIAFKLCHALLKRAKDQGIAQAEAVDLREHLDLVAVGTVADIVPLLDENRILAKAGLEQLGRTTNLGLRELKRVGQVPATATPYHIGFRIGPRLNAAGRLKDAMEALECLLTDDPRRATELAEALDHSNRERQGIEAQMLDEARRVVESEYDLDNDRVIVVARDGWHIGVVGIVASRLVQEFYRPAVVIGVNDGVGKGSCRSIEGFHIVEGLRRCSALLERFGGHEMAAGITVRADNVPKLRDQLNQAAAEMISKTDLLRPVRVEATVKLGEIDATLLDELERLAPFGAANPAPLLAATNLRCRATPRAVGKDGQHLKLWLADETASRDAIGFNMARAEMPEGDLDVAFQPEWNEFQGKRQIQLKIKAIRKSER
jgi:single-stranded-DNA-specific exonuclease